MDKGVPRLLSPDYWAGWTQASGVRPPGRPQPHGRHATGQHTGAYAKDLCMTTNPPPLPSVGCSATKQRKIIFSKDIKRTLWEEVKELERCWWSGETPLRGPVQSSRLLPARLQLLSPTLESSQPRCQRVEKPPEDSSQWVFPNGATTNYPHMCPVWISDL